MSNMTNTPTPAKTYLQDVHAFLLGEGDLEGHGFGEKPQGAGSYWWRRHLREAIQSDALRTSGEAAVTNPLPDGWVPLVITHDGQYPEEVAYGPQRMMDRLGKWLRKYFDSVAAPTAQPAPAAGNWIAADDVNRLVRELDVALNGEAGAAAQASLCDVVGQVKRVSAQLGRPVLSAPAAGAVAGPVLWDEIQRLARFADQATRMGLRDMHNNLETLAEELTKLLAAAPTPAAQQRAPHRIANLVEQPTAQPAPAETPVWHGRWAWVPVEPSTAMLIAGNHGQPGNFSALKVWQDMLDALQHSLDYTRPIDPPTPTAQQAPPSSDWWRKRADEIEAQVAATGSQEAMRCYTDMRTLLQAATAQPAPAAFQRALDIRAAQGWKLGGDKVPVLYTDSINGKQVCRDDLWLCTAAAFDTQVPHQSTTPSKGSE